MFSVPFTPFKPKATEQQLERIYAAAGLGLTGDALAMRARISPTDYRRMREADPMVEAAELLGMADKQAEIAEHLHSWAASGDKAAVRACIAILQNKHGWVTKTQVDVNVDERISIKVALERAKSRVIEADYDDVIPALEHAANDAVQQTLSAKLQRARTLPTIVDEDD